MPELCLITVCMGRLEHLERSLPAAFAQPGCTCVVVDYSCPQHCGDWVERHYPAVKVVRVPGETHFSPSHARNKGAAATNAPWLCFFDADVILNSLFADRILPTLQARHFYVAEPWKRGLTGTVICPREDFLRCGGYDEVYQGWGEEDKDLYQTLLYRGLKERGFPEELATLIPHDDQQRVQHHAVKSPQISQTINLLYRHAKFDLMRLTKRDLAQEERRNLYAEADQCVQMALKTGQESQWRINFRRNTSLLGQEIISTLIYTLNPP